MVFTKNGRDRVGQGMVELALILSLGAVVSIGALSATGGEITDTFSSVVASFGGAFDSAGVEDPANPWTHTVTLTAGEGTGDNIVSTLPLGTGLALPGWAELEAAGWEAPENKAFDGWEAPGGAPAAAGLLVGESAERDESATYTARWRALTYTVSFSVNGGSGTAPSTQSVAVGETIAAPGQGEMVAPANKEFVGWALDTDGDAGARYVAGATITGASAGETISLKAVWKMGTYTVAFAANGGSGTMESVSTEVGRGTAMTPGSKTAAGGAGEAPLPDPAVSEGEAEGETYFLEQRINREKRVIHARVERRGGRCVVLAGSEVATTVQPTLAEKHQQMRRALSFTIVAGRTTFDILFETPSGAASFVCGSPAGKGTWQRVP